MKGKPMNNAREEESVASHAATAFRAATDATDELTRSRLQASRRLALDGMETRPLSLRWQIGGVLTACLIAGVLSVTTLLQEQDDIQVVQGSPTLPMLQGEEMALVQDLELIEELAFVAYLSELDLDDEQVL